LHIAQLRERNSMGQSLCIHLILAEVNQQFVKCISIVLQHFSYFYCELYSWEGILTA
jgi:hypothetical protein